MVTTVENIINAALRRIGYPTPIGFVMEGSKASRIALDVYSQTRDDLLRAQDWPFARRDVTLAANGQTAPAPWPFEYGYPTDCLKVRYVQPLNPGTMPVYDPRPTLFTDYNDTRTGSQTKVILANISPATLVYTAQVTDPNAWDASFVEALIEEISRRFVPSLSGSPDLLKIQEQQAAMATAEAIGDQVNFPPSPSAPMPEQRK